MSDDKDLKPSKSEMGFMISATGTAICFVISLTQPLMDWQDGKLQSWVYYLGMMMLLCSPFLIGLVISICLRRNGK